MTYEVPYAAAIVIAALLGAIFGSFTTALVHRIPAGESWFSVSKDERRSHCTACGHTLNVLNLIPVISWLVQRGRCAYCKSPISVTYLLTELAVIIACTLYVSSHWRQESWPHILLTLLSFPFLTALFIIDCRTKTLPNLLVLIVFALGCLRLVADTIKEQAVSGLFIEYGGGLIFFAMAAILLSIGMSRLLKKQALGGGDVKFMAVAGLWLGLSAIGNYFLISGVIGVLFGVFWQKIKGETQFPFGPALILSVYILLMI